MGIGDLVRHKYQKDSGIGTVVETLRPECEGSPAARIESVEIAVVYWSLTGQKNKEFRTNLVIVGS